MLNIKIDHDEIKREDIALYLEDVIFEIRQGNNGGYGWELVDLQEEDDDNVINDSLLNK